MKMRFLLASLILASGTATATSIDGVDVPDTVTVANGGSQLMLNGAGVREKFFLDIYVGALYLPAKSSDAKAILASPDPACVAMHFLYKEVSREKIVDAWNDGLTDNQSEAEMQALRPQLDQFNALFRAVHRGDVIRICFLPGTGTEVRINGEQRGTVPGESFFHALLGIWLGAHPVSADLKQRMLGLG
jgi:hypothetical protein